MNSDLEKERKNASFDPIHLTYVLDGSPEKAKRRKYISDLVDADNILGDQDMAFMGQEERYEFVLKKEMLISRRIAELNLNQDDANLYESISFGLIYRGSSLHKIAFHAAIKSLASEEQKAVWLPMIEKGLMYGSYAQTEIGHGSHVRGLETTAEYDVKNKQFVLNTPKLTSIKCWPGNLGKSSNHTLLLAQLYLNGDNYGMHPFLVQLRDIETHEPLPGVTVMDMGPKFALDANDNGILKLDNVRIPRENLLMKFAKVLEDGSYERPELDKLQYASMINIRASLPTMAAASLGMACTIAIRYSCVRRQSEIKPGGPEVQVLDFYTQRAKLFPLLATSYAFWFIGEYARSRHEEVVGFINQGNFDALNEHHALLAGLKGYCTSVSATGIEQCRLSCGGHGFSLASGLPQLFTVQAGAVTAEGEATVMLLQTAKNLMKNYNWVLEGKEASPLSAYLKVQNSNTVLFNGCSKYESLITAFEHRAWRLVKNASDRMRKLLSTPPKLDKYDAWNLSSVSFLKAAVAHCELIIARAFVQKISSTVGPAQAPIETLCRLYVTNLIIENSGDFLLDGYMTTKHLEDFQNQRVELFTKIRQDAVAYVDAYGFSDRLLGSVLGRYDGQVYENLYKWAQKSPLNRSEVHDSYGKYLKQLQTGAKL